MIKKEIIARLVNAPLNEIQHESINQVFVGYSKDFSCKIFVKVFTKEQYSKFNTEACVTKQLGNRVLQTFCEEEKEILVLRDCEPKSILELDDNVSFNMGKCLADFHRNVRPFKGLKCNKSIFDHVTSDINKVNSEAVQNRLMEINAFFQPIDGKVRKEIEDLPLIILHGDVGKRNFNYVDSRVTLIDFERVQRGYLFQDFVKLFYQDFKNDQSLIRSFLRGYQSVRKIDPISVQTKMFFVFSTAVGIMKYLNYFNDKEFEECGNRMLDDISRILG